MQRGPAQVSIIHILSHQRDQPERVATSPSSSSAAEPSARSSRLGSLLVALLEASFVLLSPIPTRQQPYLARSASPRSGLSLPHLRPPLVALLVRPQSPLFLPSRPRPTSTARQGGQAHPLKHPQAGEPSLSPPPPSLPSVERGEARPRRGRRFRLRDSPAMEQMVSRGQGKVRRGTAGSPEGARARARRARQGDELVRRTDADPAPHSAAARAGPSASPAGAAQPALPKSSRSSTSRPRGASRSSS